MSHLLTVSLDLPDDTLRRVCRIAWATGRTHHQVIASLLEGAMATLSDREAKASVSQSSLMLWGGQGGGR